ncbi:MAG: SH3 domain-containing protein [Treponema sp.]|jgi:hypothetical protein|nr:SH3 domain-containing protein [Treponema sp.]
MRKVYCFFSFSFWLPVLLGWFFPFFLGSCTNKLLGWGILLWAAEDPAVPSGTVLPVYIRSNINQHWVAGIPEEYQLQPNGSEPLIDKFEIPLAKLELVGSKKAAQKRAETFADLALTYGETLQDGLPIRAEPDNSARRTYRLRMGEVVKILEEAQGAPPISASGEALAGVWYKVLTENGSAGYCFSYRLRLFEHKGGTLAIAPIEEEQDDPELDQVLTKTWSPESYGIMVNTNKLDLEELSQHWRFSPGQDTGIAHIYVPAINLTFGYTSIVSEGNRTWRFEGAPLQMRLRSDATLEVQFTENGGALRTLLFVALSSDVEDLIIQETARQEALFKKVYDLGPMFNSNSYGSLLFTPDGRFSWTGYDFLVPLVIPETGMGNGAVSMGLFLSSELASRYDGAFSFRLEGLIRPIHFLYTLDNQGLRIEYIPPGNLDGPIVTRQASSPLVIYFYKAERSVDIYTNTEEDTEMEL